jgi:hypothetical protein
MSGLQVCLCVFSSLMVRTLILSFSLDFIGDQWFWLFWKVGGEWFTGVFVCFLVIYGSIHSHSFILFRFYWWSVVLVVLEGQWRVVYRCVCVFSRHLWFDSLSFFHSLQILLVISGSGCFGRSLLASGLQVCLCVFSSFMVRFTLILSFSSDFIGDQWFWLFWKVVVGEWFSGVFVLCCFTINSEMVLLSSDFRRFDILLRGAGVVLRINGNCIVDLVGLCFFSWLLFVDCKRVIWLSIW